MRRFHHAAWRLLRAALGLVLAGSALSACADAPTTASGTQPGVPLRLVLQTSAALINTLVVEVTAADLPEPLAFNLVIQNGVAQGTIVVPAGSARTVTLRAFDTHQIETHRGSRTIDVREGVNPAVSITLIPLDGGQTITGVLGSLTIGVTPATATLAIGDTVSLVATILDAQGAPVEGTVTWASLDPTLVSVDRFGVATARREGSVQIVAVYAGTAGSATITVSPPAPAVRDATH